MNLNETWWGMNKNYRDGKGESFDDFTMDLLIREAGKGPFRSVSADSLPPGFEFLKSCVDLGLWRMATPEERKRKRDGFEDHPINFQTTDLEIAFNQFGVRVPGSPYRLRCERALVDRVELADGNETAILPGDWKQFVCCHGNRPGGPAWSYVGKLVVDEAWGVPLEELDLSDYDDTGDGWLLKQASC